MTTGVPRQLRQWQQEAFALWKANGRRGIVSVVTGGGKTVFALECLRDYRKAVPAATVVIVVPTIALLDQWIEELVAFIGCVKEDICILSSKSKIRLSRISLGVINSVAELAAYQLDFPVFLIVDECHRAAATQFSKIFTIRTDASLGLSATPDRQYDDGLNAILVPHLGPIIFNYDYKQALLDGVIVKFALINVVFEFADAEAAEYIRLTRAIQAAAKKFGWDSEKTVGLMLRRNRVSNLSLNRIKVALGIIARHRGKRILLFHEDLHACELIARILAQNGVSCAQYHSKIPLWSRVQTLSDYRSGKFDVLITCRALDEGFNVPEAEIGIIAASTASYRQRIQRLGRVLRHSPGKTSALIYSIIASTPEIMRLAKESEEMDELVEVTWTRA